MYMFYALAIVCDDFFVPSLEKICEVRALILSMSELGTGTALAISTKVLGSPPWNLGWECQASACSRVMGNISKKAPSICLEFQDTHYQALTHKPSLSSSIWLKLMVLFVFCF